MSNIGKYDHLEENDPLQMLISMADLARMLIKLNYGQQRLLSALVLEREKHPYYTKYEEYRNHTNQLAKLLEDGFF